MDADDISRYDRFHKQLIFLKNNPNVSVVGGSIQESNKFSGNIFTRRYPENHLDIINCFPKGSQLAHVTVCFRSSAFNFICYNQKNRFNEDLELWYDAIKKNLVFANIPDILVSVIIDINFFKRRRLNKSIHEFIIMLKIVYYINPFSINYIFPILKFTFRLFPVYFVQKFYNSKYRNYFLSKC